MADDPHSEFERIFGKTQKSGDANSAGSTQKLPSDSDLLGIRTDSDRFLVKNVPEQLPIEKDKAGASSANPAAESKSSQDAMTIALNVNVFANLGKSGKKPGEGGAGPTFVIPLSKEAIKTGVEIQTAGSTTAADRMSDTDAEFTRIMQIKDSVKVPKPKSFFEVFEKEEKEETEVPAAAVPEPKPAAPEPTPPPATILPGVTATSGPSDFTKVVKGSELRALQDKLAASAGNAPGGAAQACQSSAPPSLPQYVPAPNAPWPGQAPNSPHRTPPTPHTSKLSQYMPLIIGLNVLVLLVILLIVFFALKKYIQTPTTRVGKDSCRIGSSQPTSA